MIRRMDRRNCEFIKGSSYSIQTLIPSRLFMHGGHTNHLTDFSWNLNDPWLIASAAEDNKLQIWKVANSIVGKDEGDLSLDEIGR